MKKILLIIMVLITCGPTQPSIERAALPEDVVLIIAHRGASAYVTDHTFSAYDLAIRMNSDYIEIDLQMTKDGRLIALHDTVVTLNGSRQAVADILFNDFQHYSLENENSKIRLVDTTPSMDDLRIVGLAEILLNYGDTARFYIELKSPHVYPGIEKKLLNMLRKHHLLHTDDIYPKIVIQSFNENSLRKIFSMEPSIPLVKLYKFEQQAKFTNNELRKLTHYASGVGINVEVVTPNVINSIQNIGLHVYPYTINDDETMRILMKLGVNGIFTDRPDVGLLVRNEFEIGSE